MILTGNLRRLQRMAGNQLVWANQSAVVTIPIRILAVGPEIVVCVSIISLTIASTGVFSALSMAWSPVWAGVSDRLAYEIEVSRASWSPGWVGGPGTSVELDSVLGFLIKYVGDINGCPWDRERPHSLFAVLDVLYNAPCLLPTSTYLSSDIC